MYRAALLIALVVLAPACGSDADESASTTTTTAATVSAADAESALETELTQGGGSGIVQHENDLPKQITCRKETGAAKGWRCTVTPSKGGETYICMLEIDPRTKRTTKATCGRIDN